MRIQTKLFDWPDTGDHVIIIGQGVLDACGFLQIIGEAAAVVTPRHNCKVLIDLLDSECKLDPTEVDNLLTGSRPNFGRLPSKMAFVSSGNDEEYVCLSDVVSTTLTAGGLKFAVFRDANAAVNWLAG
jgi:hypothetical protein